MYCDFVCISNSVCNKVYIYIVCNNKFGGIFPRKFKKNMSFGILISTSSINYVSFLIGGFSSFRVILLFAFLAGEYKHAPKYNQIYSYFI